MSILEHTNSNTMGIEYNGPRNYVIAATGVSLCHSKNTPPALRGYMKIENHEQGASMCATLKIL